MLLSLSAAIFKILNLIFVHLKNKPVLTIQASDYE